MIVVLSSALNTANSQAQELNLRVDVCVSIVDDVDQQDLQILLKLEQAKSMQKESELTDLQLKFRGG